MQNIHGRVNLNKSSRQRRNKSKKVSRLKKIIIFLIIVLVTVGIVFIAANQYLFKVSNFNIGENSMYTRDDIIRASGIEEGTALFGFDLSAARNNIKRELAYVESVSISRVLPATVRINIQTSRPAFGFTLGRDYYIVTETFRVAEKISIGGRDIRDIKPDGVINIVTDHVIRCFVGEIIEFSDDDILYFLEELSRFVQNNEESANIISSADIRDKFNVIMNYSDRYLVRFGVFENVYSKAASSFDVIEQLPGLTGVIDISDRQLASFMPYDNISNSRLYFDKK